MKNYTALVFNVNYRAILAVVLFQFFFTPNIFPQQHIQRESVKPYENINTEGFHLLPDFPPLHHKINGFEMLIDSSVRFLFESNYDSASYFKFEYGYNEKGLRTSWEFYLPKDSDPDNAWLLDSYFTYEYDDNDNMILSCSWYSYLQEFYQYEKTETTYNELKQRVKSERFKRAWNEENWKLYEEHFFEYDSMGNLSYHENWGYDDSWNEYRPFHKRYNTYDSVNNLLQIHFMLWYRQDMEWIDLYKLKYNYDEQQNLILYTVTNWSTYKGIWWDATMDEMDYDDNNQQIEKTFYERDNDTSAWQAKRKLDFEYDQNGNLVERIESVWRTDSMQLVNRMKNEYYYDQNGFLNEDLYSFWIIDTIIPSYWSLGSKKSKINDSIGNILMDGYAHWDSISESWQYERKEYSYYSGFTVGQTEKFIGNFNLYPNPTDGVFTIKSLSNLIKRVEIYSLKASLLHQLETESVDEMIDISNLKPGIYLLRVVFKNGASKTTRVVKL